MLLFKLYNYIAIMSFEYFITYCKQHVKGDEKGEAQTFLERFL